MSEPDDTVLEKVSIEMQASPPKTAVANDNTTENNSDNATGEKPPNPPKRDYSLEKTEDQYASPQKRKALGSFPRPQFVYKYTPENSEAWMSCLRISLIVFNLFIWALGAVITALGIWMQADEDFWKIQTNLDVKQFSTAGWILIFIGIIIMVIGFIGCYGAIASKICFLIIFAIIVCIVLVMEIAVIAIVWTAVSNKNVQEDVKLKAKRAMGEMLRDDRKRDFIELLQAKLKCCGVDGPGDYAIDPANLVPIPPSCTDQNTGVPYKKGCFTTVIEYLEGKAAVVGGVAVAVFLLQLGALVFTICMVCGLRQAANVFI